jgi:hypothetical protein
LRWPAAQVTGIDVSGTSVRHTLSLKAFDGISVDAFKANALEFLNNAQDAKKAGSSSA